MTTIGPSRPHRVVLVDDDPEVLAALGRLTRGESYVSLPTQDPGQALEWLREGGISALVADYQMEAMSGVALLAEARAISPETARILITGFAGDRSVLAVRRTGLFTLFPKPWDDRELKRKLRDCLRNREIEGMAAGLGSASRGPRVGNRSSCSPAGSRAFCEGVFPEQVEQLE
jgi:DNA-binding NtrC family response regulator